MEIVYQLLITGPVAVGKTTLCDYIQLALLNQFNITSKIIPEYLCKPEGLPLLQQYLKKTITDVTFQNYIMDYYHETLSNLDKELKQQYGSNPLSATSNIKESKPSNKDIVLPDEIFSSSSSPDPSSSSSSSSVENSKATTTSLLSESIVPRPMSPSSIIRVIIYERVPDDSLLCFANLANKRGEFSDLDLLNLYNRVSHLDEKYHLPSYLRKNSEFKEIKTDSEQENTNEILSIIKKDLASHVPRRIILLQNDTKTLLKRLKMRGREGESAYTEEAINQFRHHYSMLSEYLNSKENFIRLVDLGKFI